MQTKNELRNNAKRTRSSLDIKKLSEQIMQNILKNDLYKNAHHIMIFYPIGHEVDLRELLEDKTKSFYLPKVDGENLLVCPYKKGDKLKASSFNTQEPEGVNIENTDILDLIFVPALLVDTSNNRLGYGGGFYDRFLSKQSKRTKTMVAIPSALIVKSIPSESFDKSVDLVISEK